MSMFYLIAGSSGNNIVPTANPSDDIQSIVTNNRMVLFGEGNYSIPSNFTVPNGTSLIGVPGKTIFNVAETLTITDPEDIYIDGILFAGTGGSASIATVSDAKSKVGIGTVSCLKITGKAKRSLINNCRFYNANRVGLDVSGVNTKKQGLKVTNCNADYCYIGLLVGASTEYCQFDNFTTSDCSIGTIVEGGNNLLSNIHNSWNKVGAMVTGINAPNNSHGSIVNGTFNHNTVKGLIVVNIGFGFNFNGCHIWDADIHIENSLGFNWVGGSVVGAVDVVSGSGGSNGANSIHSSMFKSASYGSGTINIETGTTLDLKNNRYMGGEDSSALNN